MNSKIDHVLKTPYCIFKRLANQINTVERGIPFSLILEQYIYWEVDTRFYKINGLLLTAFLADNQKELYGTRFI